MAHSLQICTVDDMSFVTVLFDSFMTPPIRAEDDHQPRSAQRSLDFGRSRLNSDPVPVTSDPHRLSTHSCPDTSSYLEMPPLHQPQCTIRTCANDDVIRRSRHSAGSTTVKALLTPIARRLQSSSSVTPPCRRCDADNCYADRLDHTLTDADNCYVDHLDHTLTGADNCSEQCNPAASPTVDQSSHSRYSTSHYFDKYPNAQLDSTGNTTRDGTPYSECNLQQFNNARYGLGQTLAGDTAADADASTLISSIHRNGSPVRHLSPCSAPSVEGSVETSSSLDSISTNDDVAFRAGLAQLDANIALVQRRLQGSLSSPKSACRSPRVNSGRHS